jgi:hypothetical protein
VRVEGRDRLKKRWQVIAVNTVTCTVDDYYRIGSERSVEESYVGI